LILLFLFIYVIQQKLIFFLKFSCRIDAKLIQEYAHEKAIGLCDFLRNYISLISVFCTKARNRNFGYE